MIFQFGTRCAEYLASPDGQTEGTHRHSERTRIMFSLSQFNTNLVAAICAFATSALFIGLSVVPAEIGTMSAMIV
jgi:hypothetical protein